jgi:hypothetical protein
MFIYHKRKLTTNVTQHISIFMTDIVLGLNPNFTYKKNSFQYLVDHTTSHTQCSTKLGETVITIYNQLCGPIVHIWTLIRPNSIKPHLPQKVTNPQYFEMDIKTYKNLLHKILTLQVTIIHRTSIDQILHIVRSVHESLPHGHSIN